jgi:branched-subunit amino acid aminotransferase/4-amino-4-deoxychorismate lyase
MGHLFDSGINAVIPSQRAIPAQFLEPKIKNRSRIHYLMANIETSNYAGKDNWALLVDQDGFIAEASSSNIYFFDLEKRMIYTPSLENGCVNGVSRRHLFRIADTFDLKVQEVNWKVEDLNSRLSIFTINVAGINCIEKIENRKMSDGAEGLRILEDVFKW